MENRTLMLIELCKATNYEDWQKFSSVLKTERGPVRESDIVKQVTLGGNTILHLAAKNKKIQILKKIAEKYPLLIKQSNMKGDTVLHFAARIKDSDLISVILQFKRKHHSDAQGQGQEELWRIKNDFGNTALHEAVIACNHDAVRELFRTDKEVANYLNKEGKSPLFLAVETKQQDIVDLLLGAALFKNRERHQGTSPLHAAVMYMSSGRKKICESSSSNAGPTIKDKFQSLVESWKKVMTSDVECPPPTKEQETWCKKVIGKLQKQHILLKDNEGRTALHFAASMGSLGGVRMILGACPESALEWDENGDLPIHVACQKGHVKVVKEFLLRQEKDPRFDPPELLNKKGQNLLHIAAENGKETVVEYILSKKNLENLLNERDKDGNTPLHLASKCMHPKILHLLTQKKGLDVNLLNNSGMTARDIVVCGRSTTPTLRKFISCEILKSSGTPLSENGRRVIHSSAEPPQVDWIKDRVKFLLLVAILIATVTFAAGFTICDAIAMYSSTMGPFILLWAYLGDFHLASSATYFATYLVGFAVITMSVAFMAGLHLVVRNASWLPSTVMATGVIFLLMFLGAYIFLIFPFGERAVLSWVLSLTFYSR